MSRTFGSFGRPLVLGCLLAVALQFSPSETCAREIVLHSFTGGSDGAHPEAALLIDARGNLYGTTSQGGGGNCTLNGQLVGCGTVFKISPDGSDTVLYAFQGGADGASPFARLTADVFGNFYGTTTEGGAGAQGTAFKISSTGQESVIYSWPGGGKLSDPLGGVLLDKDGNLYGTTYYGGNDRCGDFGCGRVFQLVPGRGEIVLHAFAAGNDGAYPWSDLISDVGGNLYGTTENGGGANCSINGQSGCGTVFKVTTAGVETVLYAFAGGNGGSFPLAGLVADTTGNLYGTTSQGGATNAGTVFKISSGGKEQTLLAFDGGSGGANPLGTLILDGKGSIYGTTAAGGSANAGTVFRLSRRGRETVLHSFRNGRDGANPHAGLIADSAGNLYGTTENGGKHGYGVVFKIVRALPPRRTNTEGHRINNKN